MTLHEGMVCLESPDYNDSFCSNISDNLTMMLENSSELLTRVYPEDHTASWVYTAIGVCVACMGGAAVVGNALVIYLFLRYRKLQTAANTFVFSLSCTDFLMCVVNFPMFATANITGVWPLYPLSCQVTGFVGSLTGYISINTLTAMALDRCSVIKRTKLLPANPSRTSNILMVGCIWVYSGAWAACPLMGWGKYVMYGHRTCSFDFETVTMNNVSFIISIYIFCFVIQLIIIIICYCCIFSTLHQHNKELCRMQLILTNGCIRKSGSRRQLEHKVARLLMVIILLFCVSWTPYAVLALINMFGDTSYVTPVGVAIAGLLAKCSTVINPMIYAISHPKFRKCLFQSLQINSGSKPSYLKSALYHASFQQSLKRSHSVVSHV